MKLEPQTTRRKNSFQNHRRFFTPLDMAIVKHDASVRHARIKRGETPVHGCEYIAPCGCGQEGCFIHGGSDLPPLPDKV